jgi:tetratricopeptide (TPR) repeat protein
LEEGQWCYAFDESGLILKGCNFDSHRPLQILKDLRSRAFVLADLGRWKEALPILEAIQSRQEYREGIAFYLGHCHASAHEYKKAKPHFVEALKLGLPPNLEYRAHYELGVVYFALGGYAQAKIEFEKTLQTAAPAYLKL